MKGEKEVKEIWEVALDPGSLALDAWRYCMVLYGVAKYGMRWDATV